MPSIRIKLVVIGQLPPDFTLAELRDWRSSVFTFDKDIETFQLNQDADGLDWQFTDTQLAKYSLENTSVQMTLMLLGVKLEDNWYVRRLSGNRVLFTFYELEHILRVHNIPLTNIVLRVAYAACLIYRRFGNRIPETIEKTDYAHDETRGCLFDMNPWKIHVVRSCDRPIICNACASRLATDGVSNELLGTVRNEIDGIRKPLYYRITSFVQTHPVWSIVLSVISALVIGIVTSVIADYLYDALRSTGQIGIGA